MAAGCADQGKQGSAVDALVVALAEPNGTVLTGDEADITALAAHLRGVAVELVGPGTPLVSLGCPTRANVGTKARGGAKMHEPDRNSTNFARNQPRIRASSPDRFSPISGDMLSARAQNRPMPERHPVTKTTAVPAPPSWALSQTLGSRAGGPPVRQVRPV